MHHQRPSDGGEIENKRFASVLSFRGEEKAGGFCALKNMHTVNVAAHAPNRTEPARFPLDAQCVERCRAKRAPHVHIYKHTDKCFKQVGAKQQQLSGRI